MGTDFIQDQDFMGATSAQQHAYLMSVDPDYAKAPGADQKAYLSHLTANDPLRTGKGMEHPKDAWSPKMEGSTVGSVVGNWSRPIGKDEQPLAAPLPLPFSAAEGGILPTVKALGRSVLGSAIGATGGAYAGKLFGPTGESVGKLVGGLGGAVMGGQDEIPGMPKFLRRPEENPLPFGPMGPTRINPAEESTEPTSVPITKSPNWQSMKASYKAPSAPTKLPSTFTMSADAPQMAAAIPRVGNETPPIRFGPEAKPSTPVPFAGVTAPEPQAGIPRVANQIPSVRFGPEPPAPPKPTPGTFSVTRPEPQAGIPRVANVVPSVAFGEPATPTPEIGSPENPGWNVRLPGRMPKVQEETQNLQRIITPSEPGLSTGEGSAKPRVGSEGRPATWTNERVLQLAAKGDREAIAQAVRRGMKLPENARYVAGDASYPSGSYNPRDVTKFTPEGRPIRQGGKWKPIQ